jgi:hypothetical protein
MRFVLISPRVRQNAVNAILEAPEGYTVTVAEPKRSLDQNAKLWAMLGDVARTKPEGRNWTPEVWKAGFMHYLGHQVMFCEGLEGTGPFPMGFRSSRLSVKQMADLITCVQEYGDTHSVKWTDTEKGGWK